MDTLEHLTNFASENEFKAIELVSFPPFDAYVLEQITDEIKGKIKKFNASYHLPAWEINIGALNHSIREVSVDETKKLIDLSGNLGIKKVSMHPGSFASFPELYTLLNRQVNLIAQKSVFDIFEYCKNKNIDLTIENLPFGEPLFQKPEDFELFTKKGIGMLLDTAHAVTANVDPMEFIKKFGNRISEIHLVDGFKGQPDIHYALGTGDVNYVAVLDELQRIKYKGPIILEMKSENDVVASLNLLKKKAYL